MNDLEKISNSVEAAVDIMTRTLNLYDRVQQGGKLSPQDVVGILRDASNKKGELEWAYSQLKQISKNPFDLKFIRV